MTEDTNFPRLIPPDDRLPGKGKLFRRTDDLTDDQFDLLAAAWADDALRGDSLAETEAIITSSPERRVRAESFKKLKLLPVDDRWEGRNRMLRAAPGAAVIRRTIIVTLTAAAALGALIILGPLSKSPDSNSAGPAVAEAQTMGEALIPEASPVIVTAQEEVVTSATQNMNHHDGAANTSVGKSSRPQPAGVISGSAADITSEPRAAGVTTGLTDTGKPQRALPQQNDITASVNRSSIEAMSEPRTSRVTEEYRESAESIVMMHDFTRRVPLLAAGPEASRLAPLELKAVTSLPAPEINDNWILRGVSLLAEAITKEKKNVDGYIIANACIRGINTVLGWDMELEQENNINGELLSTNFSSSLLTFSAPAKKTHP